MLNRVMALLHERGWFDTATPFETTVNLTQGACLWLLLTRRGVSDTYVKFSDCMSLQLEAQRCAAASATYPTLAPRFVGHARHQGLDVLVCRAVDYRALQPRVLKGDHAGGRVFDDLVGYFAAVRCASQPAGVTPMRNAELVQTLAAYFEQNALAGLARRWLRSDAVRRAAGLPDLPQHGDLVLNNIGQTAQGAAVVFDWEDFGSACLPGLDLFTLELQLAGDAAALFEGRRRPGAGAQAFVRAACAALDMSLGDYETLTPVYALVFRYLKRNYGPEVRERMDHLLQDIDAKHIRADV